MTADDDAAALERERPALRGLAYRMLGSLSDAEDAVQEAFVRWMRLEDAQRAAIENPGAWMMRVTSRICLDMLGSARVRRESYVGPWLPEPVPAFADPARSAAAADPLDRVTLDDSVSMALQVVLETLTPAERVAFVLHDVFEMPFAQIAETVGRTVPATRQLASSARRKVRSRTEDAASRSRHDAVAAAFAAATDTGDVDALISLLDPAVTLTSDGGGKVSAARRPVHGGDRVARFLLGALTKHPDATVEPIATDDGLGFLITEHGSVDSVTVLGVRGERVTEVWLVRNPEKLTRWRRGDGAAEPHPARRRP
ncbi:RNA polymerase sigma factor SigJ [Brachybacterium saurashtrense]|uniref:RNA polymerase sigma factor SigJ n=1 Tax=Brachybacterium saurashtrense TaxID=556288 RepID=A0A345YT28_9MICO|nr:RNA polymerase sigma factor SigJ [Brachybacterium saurashtrense]AXK44171.1 RNA polymerase sigma factor SigJ [Brachybacterium saurashtrense]AXK47080.1 RNA polymerase sigma factor SigJ [Brachybacterium saurashtrense]RRR21443.1 RNA polymerase sigma factor SigJ [Brachybacterium saurashtrense]